MFGCLFRYFRLTGKGKSAKMLATKLHYFAGFPFMDCTFSRRQTRCPGPVFKRT